MKSLLVCNPYDYQKTEKDGRGEGEREEILLALMVMLEYTQICIYWNQSDIEWNKVGHSF